MFWWDTLSALVNHIMVFFKTIILPVCLLFVLTPIYKYIVVGNYSPAGIGIPTAVQLSNTLSLTTCTRCLFMSTLFWLIQISVVYGVSTEMSNSRFI